MHERLPTSHEFATADQLHTLYDRAAYYLQAHGLHQLETERNIYILTNDGVRWIHQGEPTYRLNIDSLYVGSLAPKAAQKLDLGGHFEMYWSLGTRKESPLMQFSWRVPSAHKDQTLCIMRNVSDEADWPQVRDVSYDHPGSAPVGLSEAVVSFEFANEIGAHKMLQFEAEALTEIVDALRVAHE